MATLSDVSIHHLMKAELIPFLTIFARNSSAWKKNPSSRAAAEMESLP